MRHLHVATILALVAACADPAPEGGPSPEPGLRCEVERVSFGTLVVGTTTTRAITCTAVGDAIRVTEVRTEGDPAFAIALPEGGLSIAAGAGATLELTATPASPGALAASLALVDDAGTAAATIAADAEAVATALALTPDAGCAPGLSLGIVPLGETRSETLALRNVSAAPVTVDAVVLDGQDAEAFSLFGARPRTLAPGEALELVASFTPDRAGVRRAALVIRSDDPGAPLRQLCVEGEGRGPALECAPEPLDFGALPLDLYEPRGIVCRNVRAGPPETATVRIEAVETSSPELSAAIRDAGFPPQVAPGHTFALDVTYAPQAPGHDSMELALRLDGGETHRILVLGDALPPGACELQVESFFTWFDELPPGAEQVREIPVINFGDGLCRVADVSLHADSDPAFSLQNEGPFELRPGQGHRIQVRYAPLDPGPHAATVVLDVEGVPPPGFFIELRSGREESCLRAEDVDFGVVAPGCSTLPREVELVSGCPDAVVVTAIESRNRLLDVRTTPSLPAVVPPGGRLSFTASFAPEVAGVHGDWIYVQTADLPELGVLGYGRADEEPIQTDTFVVPSPLVDVLFVVDNSSGMEELQAALAVATDPFLDPARFHGADWHVGVTTTGLEGGLGCPGGAGGGEDGRLFPVDESHPRILTAATPDLALHWSHNMQVGACGGVEAGLEAAFRALMPGVADAADDLRHPEPGDGNLGFLREDAALEVVFVSTEDDQSPQTPAAYAEALVLRKRGRRELVSAHVVGGGSGCAGPPSGRYFDVATELGGTWLDTCGDVAHDLGQLGEAVFARDLVVPLRGRRDGDLEVRLDGRVYPDVGPRGDVRWTYDPIASAVVFTASPQVGSTIEITYRVRCL